MESAYNPPTFTSYILSGYIISAKFSESTLHFFMECFLWDIHIKISPLTMKPELKRMAFLKFITCFFANIVCRRKKTTQKIYFVRQENDWIYELNHANGEIERLFTEFWKNMYIRYFWKLIQSNERSCLFASLLGLLT